MQKRNEHSKMNGILVSEIQWIRYSRNVKKRSGIRANLNIKLKVLKETPMKTTHVKKYNERDMCPPDTYFSENASINESM